MKKYKINKVTVTIIHLNRQNLMTKEKMLDYCNGKKDEKVSVNEDLDSLFEDLRLGKEPDKELNIYFLPQLTEEELELVERKDENFMDTFEDTLWKKWGGKESADESADVKRTEMAASESDSKYVYGRGQRKTYTIEISPKEEVSSDCSLQ